MPRLLDLIADEVYNHLQGSLDLEVTQITTDSRQLIPGSAFFALQGYHLDGHDYILAAAQAGAAVIFSERKIDANLPSDLTWLVMPDLRKKISFLAGSYYGNPSQKLSLIGVTGTNGKTSIATFYYKVLMDLGHRCGLISTVENRIAENVIDATHTTPDPISLQAILSDMVTAGCTYAVMEVSSHALDQYRTEALEFDLAIFSNISHDHLDYHKTFANYIKAKKRFFDGLPASAVACVNADDRNGTVMLQNTTAKRRTYSIKRFADYRCKILHIGIEGLHMRMDEREVYSQITGKFNAYNLLSVYAGLVELGFEPLEILTSISKLSPPKGRFETIRWEGKNITAIVDYAHTPDALENVLKTLQQIKEENLIVTVFGCGGDRDKAKRPKMGAIANKYSDLVFITSDNPRSEDPEAIIKDILKGIPTESKDTTICISDRKSAIEAALRTASPNSIILVAGKGHEDYQEINGVRINLSDHQIIQNTFSI